MNSRHDSFYLQRLSFVAAMMWLIGSGLSQGVTNDHVVSFLAGPLVGFGTRAATYSWSFSYMEGFADRWAWSVTKLNEGHDDEIIATARPFNSGDDVTSSAPGSCWPPAWGPSLL
jgi:hypothetical protein